MAVRPGRRLAPTSGEPVQRRNNPREWLDLQPGDAASVSWEFDADVTDREGNLDVLGRYIQGGPGQRFIYLSWGTVSATGEFEMFRRAKLMIADVDDATLRAAAESGRLVGRFGLTDAKGNPSCARLPGVPWSAG